MDHHYHCGGFCNGETRWPTVGKIRYAKGYLSRVNNLLLQRKGKMDIDCSGFGARINCPFFSGEPLIEETGTTSLFKQLLSATQDWSLEGLHVFTFLITFTHPHYCVVTRNQSVGNPMPKFPQMKCTLPYDNGFILWSMP